MNLENHIWLLTHATFGKFPVKINKKKLKN